MGWSNGAFFGARRQFRWALTNRLRKYDKYLKAQKPQSSNIGTLFMLLLSCAFPPLALVVVPYLIHDYHKRLRIAQKLYAADQAAKEIKRRQRPQKIVGRSVRLDQRENAQTPTASTNAMGLLRRLLKDDPGTFARLNELSRAGKFNTEQAKQKIDEILLKRCARPVRGEPSRSLRTRAIYKGEFRA